MATTELCQAGEVSTSTVGLKATPVTQGRKPFLPLKQWVLVARGSSACPPAPPSSPLPPSLPRLLSAHNGQCPLEFYPSLLGIERVAKPFSGHWGGVATTGFHLSGTVTEPSNPLYSQPEKAFKVSISFDRCKITSVKCGCGNKDIFWCQHVVALSLHRIRKANHVQLRVPISETLLQMNREQLQKFAQYLITEHHSEVLPTAQRIADEILQAESEINLLPGAPDPTAGASVDDEHTWHLDEEQVREQVRACLGQGGYLTATAQLTSMFAKVREMLRARDSNGARMLTLMTEQFLADPRLTVWRAQGTPLTDKCRQFWDELGALWVCVVLNRHGLAADRQHWRNLLTQWSSCSVCPLEDGDSHLVSDLSINHGQIRQQRGGQTSSGAQRTVFHNALEASCLTWSDSHLQNILEDTFPDSPVSSPSKSSCSPSSCSSSPPHCAKELFTENEHIPTACARVDALRSHGQVKQALRLAVAIVRTMKRRLLSDQAACNKEQETGAGIGRLLFSSWNGASSSSRTPANTTAWVGHPLDPIGVLFDTLAEACVASEDTLPEISSRHLTTETSSENRKRLHHIPVSGKVEPGQTYLMLAFEVALIGLGQQRLMPSGLYAQEKACKQEERLLERLQGIDLDSTLLRVLQRQVTLLLEGGPSSGLGIGIHPESYPMHMFARYLFSSLHSCDIDLAYQVGMRAMRLPVLENTDDMSLEESMNNVGSAMLSRFPRWFVLSHVEAQQCQLASTLLAAAKNDIGRLQQVLECAQRHIHSSSQLFKLAQDAFKIATPTDSPKCMPVLNAAFELGLQVMRMTLMTLNWRRREMVRWLVTCATELGPQALITIMHKWYQYFAPIEATTTVAMTVMSQATMMQLGLRYVQREELANCARTLALQCAKRDPQNCALCALNLCEKDPIAFEAAYQVVVDAASHVMNSSQLFNIARYMEHLGYPHRAFRLSSLAMKNLHLAYNQDTHPAINDIHWACLLAHSLGRNELATLIPILVKNVQCATVLSDILRRCTMTAPGVASSESKRARGGLKLLSYDKQPLRQLMEAAIFAYIQTTHSKLTHISPRHYADFIEFLSKARDTFHLAHDGHIQFAQLIENMKLVYKGKKKLMYLIKERFGL
ncbi:hypothetical protein BaRGS_00000578 [Batillaria attramentaria]|uniref:SWIM-type domain-containing protein n=1 Tax=Batillaria attramentaria TaxID=370345 RepID=A0ABD0M915_9CAEN